MNNLFVRAANIADYTRIAEYLKISKIEYYTYNTSSIKPSKALIKYLLSDLGNDEIHSDHISKDIPVQKVSHYMGRDNKPFNMYIVSVEQRPYRKII